MCVWRCGLLTWVYCWPGCKWMRMFCCLAQPEFWWLTRGTDFFSSETRASAHRLHTRQRSGRQLRNKMQSKRDETRDTREMLATVCSNNASTHFGDSYVLAAFLQNPYQEQRDWIRVKVSCVLISPAKGYRDPEIKAQSRPLIISAETEKFTISTITERFNHLTIELNYIHQRAPGWLLL